MGVNAVLSPNVALYLGSLTINTATGTVLINPFTPSSIASSPQDFFGRSVELHTLERSLLQGSVAIQGAMGIGKSSLLARARLQMEGFNSANRATSVLVVGNRDILTVDDMARAVLEMLVDVDQKEKSVTFKIGSLFERKSSEVTRYFSEGRHHVALQRVLSKESLLRTIDQKGLVIVCIDEADKCAVPVARLVRTISTQTQHEGIANVRFLLAGVNPYFQAMLSEDAGIARFFYKTIDLNPMPTQEAVELVETKLTQVAEAAEKDGIPLNVDPNVIPRIVGLSGGHPHLLQLLGSYVVEHENEDADGVVDERDLYGSLHRICYEVRADVYRNLFHELEMKNRLDDFNEVLQLARAGLPTLIPRRAAIDAVGEDAIRWLVENNILSVPVRTHYGLVDEFIRIRLLLDRVEPGSEQDKLQKRLVNRVRLNDELAAYTHEETVFEGFSADEHRDDDL